MPIWVSRHGINIVSDLKVDYINQLKIAGNYIGGIYEIQVVIAYLVIRWGIIINLLIAYLFKIVDQCITKI